MRLRFLLCVLLVACGPVSGRDENGRTRLMRAAQSGDLRGVERHAGKGSINDQVKDHSGLRYMIAFLMWMQQLPERKAGWTALMFAVDSGHAAVVRELLKRGADVNLGDGTSTPLSLSLRLKHDTSIVKALLAAGASPNTGVPQPLHHAVALQDTALMRML